MGSSISSSPSYFREHGPVRGNDLWLWERAHSKEFRCVSAGTGKGRPPGGGEVRQRPWEGGCVSHGPSFPWVFFGHSARPPPAFTPGPEDVNFTSRRSLDGFCPPPLYSVLCPPLSPHIRETTPNRPSDILLGVGSISYEFPEPVRPTEMWPSTQHYWMRRGRV